MSESVMCPNCGYECQPVNSTTRRRCPRCGIAYHKHRTTLGRTLRFRGDDTRPLNHWYRDASLWTLVAANLISLAFAIAEQWTLTSLMALYWTQSVIIGIANIIRIRSLATFSTSGFRINNRQPPPTAGTKRTTAWFFAAHFGVFHAVYLLFIVFDAPDPVNIDLFIALCVVAFAVNHCFSLQYNLKAEAAGKPNIGTLMFLPYLRILPMHVMIIIGGLLQGYGVVLFVLLKTIADVLMHVIEHKALSNAQARKRRLPG